MASAKWPNLIWGADDPPAAPPANPPGFVTYRLALANRGTSGLGTEIISNVLATVGVPEGGNQLSYTHRLNDHGTLEFQLPIDHAQVTKANFAVGARELHLYRNDGTGEQLVWGGRLWTADVQGWFVRFIGYTWYYDLRRRDIVADYSATNKDQVTIVRELVDASQARTNGQLGITHYDASVSGTVRDFTVCAEERRKITDVIEDFAAADDGFDFDITPDKKLRFWSPRRQSASGLTFSGEAAGPGQVTDFGYQMDGSELATTIANVGPDEDCAEPDIVTASDSTAETTYGILDASIDAQNVLDPDQRQGMADEELRNRKVPRLQPTVRIPTGLGTDQYKNYDVGDTVTITTSRGAAGGFGHFSQLFRVLERHFDVSSPGFEVTSLGLDQVVS